MLSKKKQVKMPEKFLDEPKGLVICYLGAGKGKTTAAMGAAVRASGAGMDVFILQFVKAQKLSQNKKEEGEWPVSSEIEFFNEVDSRLRGNDRIGKIGNEQLGLGFVGILGDKKEKAVHIKKAIEGLSRAREVIFSGKYKVIILDEIISALESGLLEEKDILELIGIKKPLQYLVLTGHNKYPKILSKCDLVTEMKMIKHPYYKGILAQRGIDY